MGRDWWFGFQVDKNPWRWNKCKVDRENKLCVHPGVGWWVLEAWRLMYAPCFPSCWRFLMAVFGWQMNGFWCFCFLDRDPIQSPTRWNMGREWRIDKVLSKECSPPKGRSILAVGFSWYIPKWCNPNSSLIGCFFSGSNFVHNFGEHNSLGLLCSNLGSWCDSPALITFLASRERRTVRNGQDSLFNPVVLYLICFLVTVVEFLQEKDTKGSKLTSTFQLFLSAWEVLCRPDSNPFRLPVDMICCHETSVRKIHATFRFLP